MGCFGGEELGGDSQRLEISLSRGDQGRPSDRTRLQAIPAWNCRRSYSFKQESLRPAVDAQQLFTLYFTHKYTALFTPGWRMYFE